MRKKGRAAAVAAGGVNAETTQTPGAVASCERCGKKIQVAAARREDAELFRLAKELKGVCADCVMTQFLYNTYPINMQLDEAGPELLLKPGIREAFVSCGILDRGDLKIDEIDWQRVVDNWDLPVPINKKDPRNPYRMGESPRAKKRNAGALAMEKEGPIWPLAGIFAGGGDDDD